MLEFAGYSKYWKDISGDAVLPNVQPQQPLTTDNVSNEQKQTLPPPRYSEPKLVQLMERKGIGRPSTYAPTIDTLKQRNYVELVKSKVQPTTIGLQVDDFLMQALPELIQKELTLLMKVLFMPAWAMKTLIARWIIKTTILRSIIIWASIN
jgi:DNA topoisomerase I